MDQTSQVGGLMERMPLSLAMAVSSRVARRKRAIRGIVCMQIELRRFG
jgi:hypothetical protein